MACAARVSVQPLTPGTAATATPSPAANGSRFGPAPDDRYQTAATKVGAWLAGLGGANIWPEDAVRAGTSAGIADGVAGVTLFFAELHAATGEPEHRRQMLRGADWLVATLPAEQSRSGMPPATSLYYGAPGMAFVLDRAFALTGEARFRAASRQVTAWLGAYPALADSGWSAFNDVTFGDAGIALFLLHTARAHGDSAARDLAAQAGRRALAAAPQGAAGRTWPLRKGSETILPNFSHGAAGIGYALAVTYEMTRSPEFLLGAEDAARYLLSIASSDSGALRVPYGMGREEWRSRFDVGWAHGAAGTARFFDRLARASGDDSWRQHVAASERAILMHGLPDGTAADSARARQGMDRRFGYAGVADFYLDLYETTGRAEHLEAARQITDQILRLASEEGDSLFWRAPRHSFMPDAGSPGILTGYFHGAAGYGLLLLRLDAALDRRPWTLRLPDAQ